MLIKKYLGMRNLERIKLKLLMQLNQKKML